MLRMKKMWRDYQFSERRMGFQMFLNTSAHVILKFSFFGSLFVDHEMRIVKTMDRFAAILRGDCIQALISSIRWRQIRTPILQFLQTSNFNYASSIPRITFMAIVNGCWYLTSESTWNAGHHILETSLLDNSRRCVFLSTAIRCVPSRRATPQLNSWTRNLKLQAPKFIPASFTAARILFVETNA